MLVAEFTADGALLTCNTAMADFIDSTQSQPLQSLLPRNLYQQVLAGASVECELRPAHQPEQMLNATLSGLKDHQGKVNKILLYGYDASNRSAAISETLKAMQQVLSVTERIGAIVGSIHRTSARKPAISIAGGIAGARSAPCGKIKPLAFKSLCMAPNPMVRTGVFGGRHPRLPQSGGSTGSVAVLHRGANIGGLARLPSRQGLL